MMSDPYFYVASASEDGDAVTPIVSEMERAGISTWYASKDLQPGQDWEAAI